MKKFVFGLLAGISAGLLFAPESGKKLREKLKKSDAKISDFGKALLEAGKSASAEVQKIIETPEVREWIEGGKKTLSDFGEAIEEKANTLSEKARNEFEEIMGIALKKAESIKKEVKKKSVIAQKTLEKKGVAVKKSIKKIMK